MRINFYVLFVIVFFGIISVYLGMIGLFGFSIGELYFDPSLDCKYWTEKGIWRDCVEFNP